MKTLRQIDLHPFSSSSVNCCRLSQGSMFVCHHGFPVPPLPLQKGRHDSVSSSRGVRRSISVDTPGLGGPGRSGRGEGLHPSVSVKSEAVEPTRKSVGHPTVKRRARGRKLSSSSEGSEASEMPPSLLAKGAGEGEPAKTAVDQCLTIAEEPSPLPHENSDTALLSLDDVTQDSLVAEAATPHENAMDTGMVQLSAKPPSPSAGDTEDKSSNSNSDSSSDDSSSSDSEASDAVDALQPSAKEEMDHASSMEASTQPFSPSLSSIASAVSNTVQGRC